MRKIIKYFVTYPKAVNILILFFFVFGIAGIISLKSSFFPLIDSKFISVNANYPGASPDEIEKGVILKIEENLKGIPGITRVTSTSRENTGTVLIETDPDYDIDAMLFEIKNAVDKVPSFPISLEPVVVTKIEEQQPTVIFSLSGAEIDLKSLKNMAKNVEDDLRAVEGISQVTLSGFPDEEIEISINEQNLLAYNLSFQEIVNAVSNSNILISGGNIKTNEEDFLIRANNKNYYANGLQNLVLKKDSKGTIVRLGDISKISDKFSETPISTFVDYNSAVVITTSNTNSEDLLDSAEIINSYIDEFNLSNERFK